MSESHSSGRRPVLGCSLPTWSYGQGTDFEVAEWILGSLIAWTSKRIKISRDDVKVNALREQSAVLAAERRQMLVGGPDAAARVLREYGPRARRLYVSA